MRISDWSSDVCSSDRADKLFDTRRSVNRVFYQQLTAFEAAEKTARGAQLTRETFEQTRKASLAAAEKLEALRIERRTLGASTSRLERSEEHTSELQSLMRISYAVFCLKKKTPQTTQQPHHTPLSV